MARTLLLARVTIPTTGGDCACAYDEALAIGWTCDGCLTALAESADDAAVTVELAEL